ncbi:MAG: hypothetical protein HQL39_15625 [Alphaproteobacteria bacterium]|nr:hypothetical protein [Alphaproteobacteria bacterium]
MVGTGGKSREKNSQLTLSAQVQVTRLMRRADMPPTSFAGGAAEPVASSGLQQILIGHLAARGKESLVRDSLELQLDTMTIALRDGRQVGVLVVLDGDDGSEVVAEVFGAPELNALRASKEEALSTLKDIVKNSIDTADDRKTTEEIKCLTRAQLLCKRLASLPLVPKKSAI